jgi:predicted DNA-binding protein (MmcQ/YjbR family)
MDIEMLREYCLSLPGTTEDLKWGEHLCFMIAQKIYVITSLDAGTLTFKCDPEDFGELTARDGIGQAAHFAKTQWVTLAAVDVMPRQELEKWIVKSRALVLSKLPKKIRETYS